LLQPQQQLLTLFYTLINLDDSVALKVAVFAVFSELVLPVKHKGEHVANQISALIGLQLSQQHDESSCGFDPDGLWALTCD